MGDGAGHGSWLSPWLREELWCSGPGWEAAPQSRAGVPPCGPWPCELPGLLCFARGWEPGRDRKVLLLQKCPWLLAAGPGLQSPARAAPASARLNEGRGPGAAQTLPGAPVGTQRGAGPLPPRTHSGTEGLRR